MLNVTEEMTGLYRLLNFTEKRKNKNGKNN